ncbi:NAD-dependent epimerase/dehydratase family protein [Pontibacter sp. HSC-14F20]|uniref:NAD-dependent epimerase/dehydratase family protein n=1 Tax=Pontibacter sp. HSC-14F20 TaxID=2864136 RepID=UPI001C733307|nr:NAD-dependent epimerase/dehydratase family protein [Pontibacter sp. HSC-14F20]MBX0331884.1 NAD-dependent epimerase/dehydratase family protein [Pontibacter sp. HSC-14F20]
MGKKTRILVTGSAGFIGHHVVMALQDAQFDVVGLDIINQYYDPALKYDRLKVQGFEKSQIAYNTCVCSADTPSRKFIQLDLSDKGGLEELFAEKQFDLVVHLAAQAGVLYSLDNPMAYVESNLVGFANMLEACRKYPVKHFLFASSSSVYGLNVEIPFSTNHQTDRPISFYAATKKANEVMAHSYAHLYDIPATGMRFFTVYGPWGRPDMACFRFAKYIAEGRTIQLYNQGNMWRDFTYIDDVVAAVMKLLRRAPKVTKKKRAHEAPYRLYNIGNNQPEQLLEMVALLERGLHKKASIDLLPMQPGDVPVTYADVDALVAATGYRPHTSLAVGIRKFLDWFEAYYAAQPIEKAA